MKVCIIEDNGYRNLFPLTKTRPVFDLRCGKFTLEERVLKILSHAADQVSYVTRPDIKPVWEVKNKASMPFSFGLPVEGDRLLLNARVLFDESVLQKVVSQSYNGDSIVWLVEDTWGAIFLPDGHPPLEEDDLIDGRINFSTIRKQHYLNANIIKYPWDLITYNSEMIQADFRYLDKYRNRLRYPPLPKFTAIINNKNLMIGSHAEIHPFVTLDARNGPIIVGDNVKIEPGTYVKGPVSIGDNCLVSANTKLYDNTTLGNTCKVGGEISHTIIHGFSNKRHHGFLGNSYLGEWVNLGAGTTNSNLKNNYNTITVERDGQEVDTRSQFIGLFMGDHCRSAIGTTFNTATFVGVGCNIFGNGFPPKYIEDFTWNCIEKKEPYKFDKFLESTHRMMIRREVELSREEVQLLKSLYDSRNVVRISSYKPQADHGNGELQESS